MGSTSPLRPSYHLHSLQVKSSSRRILALKTHPFPDDLLPKTKKKPRNFLDGL
jgi:hypothetical protein